jgi:hypothetical protein
VSAATLASQWRATRQLPRYAGAALAILRDDGAGALAERVARKLRGRKRFRPVKSRTAQL